MTEFTRLPDKRLLGLATEVSEAKDAHVPRLLLKLQNILESFPAGSLQLQEAKQDIYSYQLLQLLLTSIKQDLTKIPQGWTTAAKLSIILSQCCIGFEDAEKEEFQAKFLPNVLEHELLLARKLQSKFIKTSDVLEDTKYDLLENFRMVLEAVSILYSGHDNMCRMYLESPWLLQLIMTDDARTSVALLNSVQAVCRVKKEVMSELESKLYHQYLDELIYKLSSTSKEDVAGSATRTLIVICDCFPSTVELLCIRYRGLRLLLGRWQNRSFDRDLRRLEHLLQAGSLHHANMQSLNKAASVIQAFWKSYNIRKKIKGADAAIGNFHRSFRAKKELKRLKREDEKKRQELEHWLLIERKRTMRELRYKQLKAMEILPADQIPKHIQQEQQNAAVKIQRLWKGYRVRAGIEEKRNAVVQIRAAVKIQRGVRKWMEKVHSKKKEPRNWQVPPGLTDERRVELLAKINDWRETHEVQTPAEKREDLHEKVQAKLKEFCAKSRQRRKNDLHREALLARLETDASLLLNAPKLSEVTEKDLEIFVCHSVPIATKAATNHKEELRLLHQPWWKKLGDEYQDQKYEEEAEDWKIF